MRVLGHEVAAADGVVAGTVLHRHHVGHEGELLGPEQLRRAVAGHDADADIGPVVDHHLHRPHHVGVLVDVQVEQHAGAVGEAPEAVAVTLGETDLVEHRAGARRVVVRIRLRQLRVGVLGSRTRGDLRRLAEAEPFGIDDRLAVDGQRQRLPETLVIQQFVLVGRLRVVDLAVQVEGDGEQAAARRIPMVHFVSVPLPLGHQFSVVVEIGGFLDRGLAVDDGDVHHLLVFHLKHDAVQVGQLIALLIDGVVVGIAHQRVRAAGAVGADGPGTQGRQLRVVLHLAMSPLEHGDGAGLLPRIHHLLDLRGIAEFRMQRAQVVRGQRLEGAAAATGHELEEDAVRLGKDVLDRVVVDLLDAAFLAAHLDDLGHPAQLVAGLGVGPGGPAVPPEHDVVGGEWMAIGPADLAQMEGEDAVVVGDLVPLDQVGYGRVSVRREPEQVAATELVEHVEAEHRAGYRTHPGAAVVADPLDPAVDDRLRADALLDRGQLALGDELGEQRGFPLGVPIGRRSLVVVDFHLEARPVVRRDRVIAQLGGRPQLLLAVLRRRRGQVGPHHPATQPQQDAEADARHQQARAVTRHRVTFNELCDSVDHRLVIWRPSRDRV